MKSNNDKILSLLKKHKLRSTSCRNAVLEFLLEKDCAISHPELEQELIDFDRVTLYRTLGTFLDNGILHKVLDDSGTSKYAVCSHNCSEELHFDNHVHFKCLKCNTTQCIDSITIPDVKLPLGFTWKQSDFLIQGVCNTCN